MTLLSDKSEKDKSTLTSTQASHSAINPKKGSTEPSGPPSYDQSGRDHPLTEDGFAPPSAEEISKVNLTEAFDSLSLESDSGPIPNGDTCLAHLKLLFAIQGMKEEVGYTDGLWNIWDSRADDGDEATSDGLQSTDKTASGSQAVPDQRLAALSKLREKRWAVFLARAVDRYAAWWSSLLPSDGGLVELDMQSPINLKYNNFVDPEGKGLSNDWIANSLPPLDVLMVWHAHMLNPRAYLEDAMLAGLRVLWHLGMPWVAVNAAIDNKFNYTASDDVKAQWVARTGLSWDNQDDPMVKFIACPMCKSSLEVPWTTCGLDENDKTGRRPGLVGNGYGDGNFLFMCTGCGVVLDKKVLSVAKFVKDTEASMGKGRPMPGTVLDPVSGMPEVVPNSSAHSFPRTFPNRMLQRVLRSQILELVNPQVTPRPDMDLVRSRIEAVLRSHTALKLVDGVTGLGRYRLHPKAGIAVRKMMARYWENFSPFALDLGGAVLRQGAFVEKMVKIDWLHSPSAAATMSRLLTKYERFFSIMAANPRKTAVPTLDVDLAWHTHQLSPRSYYAYSLQQTKKFIDHDDKIEEGELNTAFLWTSKTYQETYGEVYSECTCWYCETIRTIHISSVAKLLGASKNEKVADNFHTSGAASLCPPDNSAHISSHNAVKFAEGTTNAGRRRLRAQIAAAYQLRLDEQYAKAKRRAEKKGRKIPPKEQYYDHWGYQYYAYGPYMYPMWYTPGMYYMWPPGYMAGCGGAGAWAACAAGSCAGGVSAGACGGPGGCGAGVGVGGSGGCGGGGGGGCGGGCGGGGGGGGCGGGS